MGFFFLAHERNAILLFPPLSRRKTLTSSEVFTENQKTPPPHPLPRRRLIGSDDSAGPASTSFEGETGPYLPSPSFSPQRNSRTCKVSELLALRRGRGRGRGGDEDPRADVHLLLTFPSVGFDGNAPVKVWAAPPTPWSVPSEPPELSRSVPAQRTAAGLGGVFQ